MHIVMRLKITGTRDGADWPPVGGELEVPDDEGADLIRNGYALPADEPHTRALIEPDTERALIKPTVRHRPSKES